MNIYDVVIFESERLNISQSENILIYKMFIFKFVGYNFGFVLYFSLNYFYKLRDLPTRVQWFFMHVHGFFLYPT